MFLLPVLRVARCTTRCGPATTRRAAAFRLLPAELTMLNDLSVFTEPWRKKRPFGFVGNAERPADRDAFFLYFMDDGTHGREEWAGRTGFWLRGGRPAEVVLRAFDLAPVERVVLRVTGGPMGDVVDARLGWHAERVRLAPGETRDDRAAGRARRPLLRDLPARDRAALARAARRCATAARPAPSSSRGSSMGPDFPRAAR